MSPLSGFASRVRSSAPFRGASLVLSSRAFRGTSLVLGVGLAVREVHDIWYETTVSGKDVQLDDRAQLILGLAREQLTERAERERRLRGLMLSGEQRARAAAEAAGTAHGAKAAALSLIRVELVAEAQNVLHPGFSTEDLKQRRQAYGNVKWTEAAMQSLVKHSPIVEVGAGEGQWQAELLRRGAGVTAFDDFSSPGRWSGEADARPLLVPQASVQKADAEDAVRRSRGRTLLLVYPPPGPMAARCLSQYIGDVLIYVGEGRGGVNADNTFFDLLGSWGLEDAISLETLPGSFEKMYVLRRAGTTPSAPVPAK
ncbi:unnamed protein product [Polarella glacialis]|uniref:Uncharacterized protein n=1 Tax=Polarella glacialis TaxID=89957 RepID=A0A813HWZ1_POLGL|nr:unnamed protein product [Polarella glacialis]CAE8689816.1 unnamed protein product [Polarella glacialis]